MSALKSIHRLNNCVLLFIALTLTQQTFATSHDFPQFMGETPNSKLRINFDPVNILLDANVLNMGPSQRHRAKIPVAGSGKSATRIRPNVSITTYNEGNRFSYELIKRDHNESKVNSIKKYLESIPTKTSLHLYNKQEQLAYWLNIYNVTLINEIVKRYPLVKRFMNGNDSFMDEKIIKIDGTELSLNDIQHVVLTEKYHNDPLIIYGLHQGYIGGPNINKKAFTGDNVYELLKSNATDFINSNRGTQIQSDVLEVSSYYSQNANYFPDFDNDLRNHLLQFADQATIEIISQTETIEPIISNWHIADLYGSIRGETGGSKPSKKQLNRLSRILKVRAKNFDNTSVTVTDLESTQEK